MSNTTEHVMNILKERNNKREQLKSLYHDINILHDVLDKETDDNAIIDYEHEIHNLLVEAEKIQRHLGCWTPIRGQRCDCPACGGFND